MKRLIIRAVLATMTALPLVHPANADDCTDQLKAFHNVRELLTPFMEGWSKSTMERRQKPAGATETYVKEVHSNAIKDIATYPTFAQDAWDSTQSACDGRLSPQEIRAGDAWVNMVTAWSQSFVKDAAENIPSR
jgi:hypothetical protein